MDTVIDLNGAMIGGVSEWSGVRFLHIYYYYAVSLSGWSLIELVISSF